MECGYWHLYRYNPNLKEEGKNPFVLDSKDPTKPFKDFLQGEVRYSSLMNVFPETAEEMFEAAEKHAAERYSLYKKLSSFTQ